MPAGMDRSLVTKRVVEQFGEALLDAYTCKGETTLIVEKDSIVEVCRFLVGDVQFDFNFLTDIAGVDYYPRVPRFEVVYHLYSIAKKNRVRLKVNVGEGEKIPSVTPVWRGANWAEREVYDMFGILFGGHPDLRRIYMPEGWEDFPLRKDYPLRGYKDEYNPYGEERK